MSSPLDALGEDERALVRPAPAPDHAGAMKAVLTDARFSDPAWIFERKLDGIRCIAIRSGKQLRLLSRNDLSLAGRYPEVAGALAAAPRERVSRYGLSARLAINPSQPRRHASAKRASPSPLRYGVRRTGSS